MTLNWRWTLGLGLAAALAAGLGAPSALKAQQAGSADTQVTYARDIAPILQRSCQNCHRPGRVAPMSLISYEDVRPWARAIRQRTGFATRPARCRPGTSRRTSASSSTSTIRRCPTRKSRRSRAGSRPVRRAATRPTCRRRSSGRTIRAWQIGEPDMIVETPRDRREGQRADWWGELEPVKIPLMEDRYIAAVEIKEVNDVPRREGPRDGGRPLCLSSPDSGRRR